MIKKLQNWYERKIKRQESISDLKDAKWLTTYTMMNSKDLTATNYTALIKKDKISISINQTGVKETIQDSVWMDFTHDTNNFKNFVKSLNELVEHLEDEGYDFKKEDTFLYGCPPNVSIHETIEEQKEISQTLAEKSYDYTDKYR